MKVSSPAFAEGGAIPAAHTCDGADRSPAIHWSPAPPSTAELALVVEDPDAPGATFIHWVLYGIPPATTDLAEGAIPSGASEGRNSFGRLGWSGPCPPRGPAHRYVFKVFALSSRVSLAPGADAGALAAAVEGRVIARGTLTGRYGRS